MSGLFRVLFHRIGVTGFRLVPAHTDRCMSVGSLAHRADIEKLTTT